MFTCQHLRSVVFLLHPAPTCRSYTAQHSPPRTITQSGMAAALPCQAELVCVQAAISKLQCETRLPTSSVVTSPFTIVVSRAITFHSAVVHREGMGMGMGMALQ